MGGKDNITHLNLEEKLREEVKLRDDAANFGTASILSFVAALAGLGTAIYGKAHGNSPFFYGGTATLALSAVSTCYFTNKLIAKFTEIKDFYKKD